MAFELELNQLNPARDKISPILKNNGKLLHMLMVYILSKSFFTQELKCYCLNSRIILWDQYKTWKSPYISVDVAQPWSLDSGHSENTKLHDILLNIAEIFEINI